VEFRTAVTCSKCKQPIVGEGFGSVCFKIPGAEAYHFFHRRSGGEDCWEAYMNDAPEIVPEKEEAAQCA
jgi:hypothetical protein